MLAFAFALAFVLIATARSAWALSPAKSLRQSPHDVWTTKDGLPEGAVLSLHETTDGYLWVGTQCCLVRYDGNRFVAFEEGSLGLKQYSFVRDLVQTADGALWAALIGGIARYSNGQFDFYDSARGLTHPFVYALAEGPGDSLWLGTGGSPRSWPTRCSSRTTASCGLERGADCRASTRPETFASPPKTRLRTRT